MFFYMLYNNFMGVTVSFLSSDLVKSWGECDGHTWGLARKGWTGGGGTPHRSVFILARAPLVGEGRVTGVYKWRETLIYIVERGDRMGSLM